MTLASNKAMEMNPGPTGLIRSYFVEAAWQAIPSDLVMQAYYRTHIGKEPGEKLETFFESRKITSIN